MHYDKNISRLHYCDQSVQSPSIIFKFELCVCVPVWLSVLLPKMFCVSEVGVCKAFKCVCMACAVLYV